MIYTSKEGDRLDLICHKYYHPGADKLAEYVAKVLEHNKGLASQPAVLPRGITIELPDIEIEAKTAVVNLWD